MCSNSLHLLHFTYLAVDVHAARHRRPDGAHLLLLVRHHGRLVRRPLLRPRRVERRVGEVFAAAAAAAAAAATLRFPLMRATFYAS